MVRPSNACSIALAFPTYGIGTALLLVFGLAICKPFQKGEAGGNELTRLKAREEELDQEITEIEKEVGIEGDLTASANILEGLVEWEDFVPEGFERQKKRWFKLNKELEQVSGRIACLERREGNRPIQ
jgi:hypothetical protein